MILTMNFAQKKIVETNDMHSILSIDSQGVSSGTISFSFPVVDIHAYWVSSLTAPSECIPWVINEESAFQQGMPFIAFINSAGINQISVGLIDLFCDLKISAKMNQETCSYDITLSLKSEKPLPCFSISLDFRKQNWQKSVKAWRELQNQKEQSFPTAVWDPVYCTWYVVHGAVTEEWCDRTAQEAKKLGFGTFILDDGWCYPDMKRVSPEKIISWYEKVGDWIFDKSKFPDAAAHIKRVQALGLKYMVWIAPYLIGDHSEMYQKLKSIKGSLYGDYLEGYYKLDTRNKTACEMLLNQVEKLMPVYGIDGLKIDFLDQIYPDQENPRSNNCQDFTAEITRRIRQHKPEALIEFRQAYTTPQMLSYGTQFRARDCPFDFLLNFRRIAQIRIALGDGIPVHADPAYWPSTELSVNIARHFIAMMAGVPMLSIDLESLSAENKRIISFWISFYRKNAHWLKNAHWEFDYSSGILGSALGIGTDYSLAIVADSKRIPKLSSPGWILNLSPEELSLEKGKIFDFEGKSYAGNNIPIGGGAFLS